jgi:phenylalanyl-tRNA synthetase alpha chain
VSQQPPCRNDISFWIKDTERYNSNDFYDLVRSIGGDTVEQVLFLDEFLHPKKNTLSHAYRITYRSMDRPLSKDEANVIHAQIEQEAVRTLGVEIRGE